MGERFFWGLEGGEVRCLKVGGGEGKGEGGRGKGEGGRGKGEVGRDGKRVRDGMRWLRREDGGLIDGVGVGEEGAYALILCGFQFGGGGRHIGPKVEEAAFGGMLMGLRGIERRGQAVGW